ncbi:MAG: division/cell wall cluster transcriptional repressor MraZ, partial [Erysipelotrichaceae bacterium]|nr:division/cell wall cluster transcriptional repressor MraZ [Erysipelotrichaceae bacterium]
ELGDMIIVTRGLDGCLNIYTKEQWALIYEQLQKLPSTRKDARMFVRMMTSKAAECEFDSQGRILIPSSLVSMAQLVKECVVVGAGNHLEIWSKENWEPMDEMMDTSFEDLAENLTEFLL